jgi:large subunit ribosomal protein L18e
MKNVQLQSLISELKKAAIEKDAAIWKRVASDLEGSTKKRSVVNLSKIDKFSSENDTVIVPGKVLGMGELNKKVTVAAYNFSRQAQDKIKVSGSSAISIIELVRKNPKGAKLKILG